MIELTDTNASGIANALMQARKRAGSSAMGMVMTLVVVVDEDAAEEAMECAKTASQELDKLEIGKPASMKGYSREKFPHWKSTGKNCDVRDSVLKRDGTKVKLSGCNVVAGTWKSVYDDKTLTSPGQADIDHVVPLANAWRSGAASCQR